MSVQLANHEVGTVQPAAEVVAAARERGVLTHVDACAAAGHLPIDFAALGADLVLGHRPQARRAQGHRRPARPPGPAAPALPPRRRPGAGPPGRDRERGGGRRLRRRRGRTGAGGRPARPRRRRPGPSRSGCSPRRRSSSTGSTVFGDPVGPAAASRLFRGRGRGGGASPPRAGPARRRRPLRLVVFQRDVRAVSGPVGHGRRRRPLAAGQRRLVELRRRHRRLPRRPPRDSVGAARR